MFLKNCWYVAAWEHEIVGCAPVARMVAGEPVVIYRGASGEISAFEDRCAHRQAPLSLGRVEGDNLRCMYHGLLFGPDGHCRQVPGSQVVPRNAQVRRYPLEIKDSWIWIWMGDPALADVELCPNAFGLNDPKWTMRADQIDYAANYMLISDNLCDLSHVDFVHETTLGHATGLGWAEDVPRVVPLERGIRVERWNAGKPASPKNPTLVDNWSTYDYLVPGIFIMETRSFSAGTAELCAFGAPSGEPMTHRVEQQAVTPIDDKRSRYFFATGFDSRLPQKVLDPIFDTVMKAFAEDRTMIEGQQRIIDVTSANHPSAFIPHDKGPSMFRRVFDRVLKAELRSSPHITQADGRSSKI